MFGTTEAFLEAEIAYRTERLTGTAHKKRSKYRVPRRSGLRFPSPRPRPDVLS